MEVEESRRQLADKILFPKWPQMPSPDKPVRNKNLTRGLKNFETALGSPAACRGGGGPLIRDGGQYLNFTPFRCLLLAFLRALAARPGGRGLTHVRSHLALLDPPPTPALTQNIQGEPEPA